MSFKHGWSISSSDDSDDASILPQQDKKKYRSPIKIFKTEKEKKNSVKRSIKTSKDIPAKTLKCDSDSSVTKDFKKSQAKNSVSNNPLDIWSSSAPYHFLLTTVSGISIKHNLNSPPIRSMGIKEILSPEFGEIIESVQFNYCIDMEWLMEKYPIHARSKPMLVVHGERGPSFNEMKEAVKPYPNVEFCRVDLPPYGTHHTKMMFLRYQEGIRIIILTANLVKKDWQQKTQGMWISPVFPLKSDRVTEKSLTNFKADMISYLQHYTRHKMLTHWMDLIKAHDLSAVNVFLIGSVPGRHKEGSLNKWGHTKLRKILSTHIQTPKSSYDVVGQFSSLGSLGENRHKWLCSEWLISLASTKGLSFNNKTPHLKLIFPCVEDVRKSLEGYPAGASIPYSRKTAEKQPWLEHYLHKWRADHTGRTEAAPHIKSYARISQDNSSVLWWLITSANLSKAAWGGFEKKNSQLAIKSFELGVLFIPKLFNENSSTFSLSSKSSDTDSEPISLPFSVPLVPYVETDQPWIWDATHKALPDRHGNAWCPTKTF